MLGHSVFTSYPECFLLLVLQGPGAGAVRKEASLEGGTAECLCGPGKKCHTPCPGAAAGTEGDTSQPGSYPFHFPVPGHVNTLGLSFSDFSLPASQASRGSKGICWYLSHAWVLEVRSWPVQASVFKLLHASRDRGKIRTWFWVEERLRYVVGMVGKRHFWELGTELLRPFWERCLKCGNESAQHTAVEGQEKTYVQGGKGWVVQQELQRGHFRN